MTIDRQKERVAYLKTISRLEPEITAIDASTFYATAAISLKRIADLLEELLIQKDSKQNEAKP